MQIVKKEAGTVNIQLDNNELLIINNALNETLHGPEIPDFQTRMGTTREEAEELLRQINRLLNEQ